MLTPEQIAALRDAAEQVAYPITEYLIADIARRISEAGQLTSTASYQVWRAQQLGLSQKEIRKRLKALLRVSSGDIQKLLTQSAEVGYNFDLKNLPHAQAVPFAQNETIQQIVQAAVNLAQGDFTNITQTLGMVDPNGVAMPLQDAYRSATDFAFKQVSSGATDYNTAIRQATANLAKYGLRTIDYESGVHTSLEAAVRRNIMGGLGLMQEQISQHNHEQLGADGWEISAHANSAPDHEPIQGRQYSDAEYETLNNSLVRRIGTLNCGHSAFPILLGISSPQYTQEQLQKLREANAKGITYQGKHYTGYEATQMQRKLERAARSQKRRILVDEATGDKEKLLTDQIKLTRLNQEYRRFSKSAGLRTESERAQVAGFGRGQAASVTAANVKVERAANSMYNTGSSQGNVTAYLRDQPIRARLRSDDQPKLIEIGKQGKHILGHNNYLQGRSYLTISEAEAQALVDRYAGTGVPDRDRKGQFNRKELIVADRDIGVNISIEDGAETPTNRFYIHYSNSGAHIVPTLKGSEKK